MEQRILIFAPIGRDAALAEQVLELAMVRTDICHSAEQLAEQLELGAAGVLTVEEALPAGACAALTGYLAGQPAWSDLPVILLTQRQGDPQLVRHAINTLGNLTLLERPVGTLTLVTSAHALLRARARQYMVREAERRKDEFLASLGHELRNPLAPIKTSVALLGHLYPQAPAVAKVREVIERQVTHLTRLVDDLLDVARITSGKTELRREHVHLRAVVEHVNELCLQSAASKRIGVDFALPPQDVVLHADYARVVQILANIVSNAIKFTPPDGSVAVRAWVDDAQLSISVTDTGVGLDADAIPRIFSMFEQGNTVSGQMASGLGIGLSLARTFAEMHGGSVLARSEGVGKGSEFLIRLPVVVLSRQPAEGGGARVDVAPTSAARAAQVLVVDDNCDAADSLKVLFQMEGYEAAAAYDGCAALAAAKGGTPDLIVMDLGMPGMDGYETARQIRQLPGAAGVLMIALTGWGQGDARSRTIEAGFDYHLTKPVEFNDIIGLVKGRLDK
ncbi:signal transduction histidine kinase [Janthinobacterium sp. CG_23.3]|uniref:hybrid sensor histidine kinase/response regulator n=1 Tax=Janthinobacterium sp. CG_23.3 TaxID=3349634 RepID=UPI0038D3A7FE